MERQLQQILPAINGQRLLAVGDDGAHAGGGQHAAQARASGADLLRQGALGHQGDLHGARVHHLAHFLVHADVGGDEVLDLTVVDQLLHAQQTPAGQAAIVADDGEVLHAGQGQGVHQLVRAAAAQEAAHHHAHPVLDQGSGLGDRCNFSHNTKLPPKN